MKFSLRFNNDLPTRDYLPFAKAAEAAGFDQFWVSDDLFLRSAPVILTALALATERIEIGSCILNPYTMHPAEIAMFAATLDELSGGRFNLGLSAGAADFVGWLGLDFRRPRTRALEAMAAINALTSNQKSPRRGSSLPLYGRSLAALPITAARADLPGRDEPEDAGSDRRICRWRIAAALPARAFPECPAACGAGIGAGWSRAWRYRSGGVHLVFDRG